MNRKRTHSMNPQVREHLDEIESARDRGNGQAAQVCAVALLLPMHRRCKINQRIG